MAIGDSLSSDRVTIWFAPANTVGADLDTKGQRFQSFITNFDESGGAKDIEQVNVFSSTGIVGNVPRKKPRELKELTFDIMMRFDERVVDFKKIENEEVIAPEDEYEDDFKVGLIVIEATDGDGNYYWSAYNNVDAINFDTEFSAEEEWKGSLNFKLPTANANGLSNIKTVTDITEDVSTGLTSWS